MSLTIGLTTLFGSAVGAGIGYVGGILTHLGSSSRSLSPKATAFAGAIILAAQAGQRAIIMKDSNPSAATSRSSKP